MGLLDKLLNKNAPDGEADKQTSDWLSKLDEQITESTGESSGTTPPPPPVPEALQPSRNPGPVGDVIDHLHVLSLDQGATWAEVTEAHRSAIAGIGDYGDQDQRRRINGAYAALRVNG
jgi:hypothetical protein